MSVQITVLGSGDAFGTPMPGCNVKACTVKTPKNNRTRFSLFIESRGCSILIGASPDLRQQFFCENISLKNVDYILLTHSHYDQIGGLSEFDAIGNRPAIKLLTAQRVIAETKNYYDYLFEKKRLDFQQLELNKEKTFDNFSVTSFELNHHNCFCLGFRLVIDGKVIVVAVDTNANLSPLPLNFMKNADLLFLDGMAESASEIMLAKRDLSGKSDAEFEATTDANKRGHMLISEAMDLSKKLAAKQTILAHLSHYNSSHEEMQAKYETKDLTIGFDGMKIVL